MEEIITFNCGGKEFQVGKLTIFKIPRIYASTKNPNRDETYKFYR